MAKEERVRKKITHTTMGFGRLDKDLKQKAMAEFESITKEHDHWLYALCGGLVLAVDCGGGEYTAMLAQEYE